MNRYNFFGAFAVIGILITTYGSLLKILHHPNADTAITIGLFFQGIGLAALCWFLFMWFKKKNSQNN